PLAAYRQRRHADGQKEGRPPAEIDRLAFLQRFRPQRLDIHAVASPIAWNEEDVVEDIAAEADDHVLAGELRPRNPALQQVGCRIGWDALDLDRIVDGERGAG